MEAHLTNKEMLCQIFFFELLAAHIAKGVGEGIVTLTVAGQTFGRRMPLSCRSGRIPPLLRRFVAELAERVSGDQMALRVEAVVDGGVGGQKSLR
jgi:hypothetical protein